MSAAAVELVERNPTVEEYQKLRDAVRWWPVDRRGVEIGLEGSLFSVCALRGGEVVGCGRVIGDGGIWFYLQDLMVLPDHRGGGIGRRIMDALLTFIQRNSKHGAFIGVMPGRGTAPFYESFGFRPRPTGMPGMYRVRE